MALTTLYLQRHDQRCAALSEVETPTAVAGDDYESTESVVSKKRAEIESARV
jgi:hypothetical protein